MMSVVLATVLSALVPGAAAGVPQTEDKEWEKGCGGSNIAVTRVDGKIATIEAFVEHFAEGRSWQCHFKDGNIISAAFRHFTVVREPAGEFGEFTTAQTNDKLEVFHFPDHDLSKLDPELREELNEVLAIAMDAGKPEAGNESGSGSVSE